MLIYEFKLIEIPDYTKKVALGINKPRGRKRKAIAGQALVTN
jgi:hypothetical protein